MPEIPIESIDDPRVAVYRDLPKSHPTRRSGQFVAEGQHLVTRLLASRYRTESILSADSHLPWVRSIAPADVPVFVLARKAIHDLVGFRFHRGVLACGRREPYPALADLVPPAPQPTMLVVLSGVQDRENVGAILRASAAFGVDAVMLGPHCADPFSRRVARVSMGAVWKMPLTESPDLARDIDWLEQQAGVAVIATLLDDAAEPLAAARHERRVALLFGGEAFGLDADLIGRCRHRVTIPMQLDTDSLNVAMAASIFLYHFTHVSLPNPPGNR
jgi:tRNA G18 (ribose-2'-O)-methylase SpoU